MSNSLTIQTLDGARGVILPGEVLEAMGLEEGDALYVVQDDQGTVYLTPKSPDDIAALDDAHAFMDSHAEAFRELAK